jgi:hypothetical protein
MLPIATSFPEGTFLRAVDADSSEVVEYSLYSEVRRCSVCAKYSVPGTTWRFERVGVVRREGHPECLESARAAKREKQELEQDYNLRPKRRIDLDL